ncbi:MAG: apolipoprotein N-acyltransferase [Actinomycetota bacterium]
MLPRPTSPPARRRGADALPRLRVAPGSGAAVGRRDRILRGSAAAVSGVLLALAQPPHDLDLLVFAALVPLVWAWRRTTWRDGAVNGYAFGLVYFAITLGWSRHFGFLAFVALVLANAVAFLIVGGLVGAFSRRGLHSPWLVAAVWVVGEGLRNRVVLGGMPWGEAGLALHGVPWGRAVATWGGIPLVSFLIVAWNGWVLDLGRAAADRRRALVPLGALAAVLLVGVGASVLRPESRATGTLRYALLQADTLDRELTAAEQMSNYQTEQHFALADRLRGRYDLVVFPESALERDPERDPVLRRRIVALADRLGATVVVNARTAAPGGGLYNANLVYDPGGTLQGEYAKRHLVPFGEYVPLRGLLDWIPQLGRVSYDYTPGRSPTRFRAGGHPFETVICYESAYPRYSRDAVGRGAELLVVSTSNRSFGRSGLSAQHVALSQMRAAETGRPVLHAAVSGATAVIDPDGRVRQRSALFERAITRGTVTTTAGTTPSVRLGDWVLAACLVGLVAGAVVARRRGPSPDRPYTDDRRGEHRG